LLLEAAEIGPPNDAPTPQGISISPTTPEILEAVLRLLRLIDRPRDLPILAPLIEKELLWLALTGPQGNAVRQIGLADSSLSHIGHAIRHLRTNAFATVQVEELAQVAAMSVSSFHRHFRTVTAMSPIQYQKRIRLQEARLMLLTNPTDIAGVGHAVGYGSASQFSREYRREFGVPPSTDAERLREPAELSSS
jgi:AraC-like DNA-binding protein